MVTTLSIIITHLLPEAIPGPGGNFTVSDNGTGPRITRWGEALGPQPTAEQIAQATAEIEAIESARAQILAAFRSLPRGVQAFFEPCRQAVGAAIDARDWAGVREIIATTPAPTPALETVRQQFAALANQLLPA